MKTIYYYQTFIGLDKLLSHTQDIDVITISSIHFDSSSNKKQMYLNDNLPNDIIFKKLWTQAELIHSQGVTIMLMIGGAGGAYQELFSDFNTYYSQLKELLDSKSFIDGINIDIEETVKIEDVKMFITKLKEDHPDIKISLAPIAESMTTDNPGMGGFSYKELYNSEVGVYIDWFNVQSYYSYTFETYDSIINNGYPPSKIVFGMESGQFKDNFNEAINEIKKIKNKYPDMAGVYDWEYFDAPPDKNEPNEWARLMKEIDR